MFGAVPEVCRRHWGAMHILARRRCTSTVLHIRRRGNVLRLRRAVGRGAGAALGVEGSDPRGTGARFGRGAARVFTRSSPPFWGRSPTSNPLREGQIGGPERARPGCRPRAVAHPPARPSRSLPGPLATPSLAS